jgi:hypothetical protein
MLQIDPFRSAQLAVALSPNCDQSQSDWGGAAPERIGDRTPFRMPGNVRATSRE